jgi:hypothetical protein
MRTARLLEVAGGGPWALMTELDESHEPAGSGMTGRGRFILFKQWVAYRARRQTAAIAVSRLPR